MTPIELLKEILAFIQDIDARNNELKEQLSVYDKQQQEILHYIEGHKLDASKSCKLVKQLRLIRERRRDIKNEMEVIRTLKDYFVDRYKNKNIEGDIINTLKALKELEKKQLNPKYKYQYLTEDLEVIDEDTSNRPTVI